MKIFLQLNAVEREEKANSIVLSGVKQNDGEKTNEINLEILKKQKVDPEIGKNEILSVYRLKIKETTKRKIIVLELQ